MYVEVLVVHTLLGECVLLCIFVCVLCRCVMICTVSICTKALPVVVLLGNKRSTH